MMIWENVDDSDIFLRDTAAEETGLICRLLIDYLPTQLDDRRRMVVTTRSRDIGERLAWREECINVGAFSVEESMILLSTKVRRIVSSRTTWQGVDR